MNNDVSTDLTAVLIECLDERGVDTELVAEMADLSRQQLLGSLPHVPNEVLIILFAQARQFLGDDDAAYRIGFRCARKLLDPGGAGSAELCPEAESVSWLARELISAVFTRMKVETEVTGPRGFSLRVSPWEDYLHTHDHCLCIRGMVDGIVSLAGGKIVSSGQARCMVTADRAGKIGGHAYRIDDDGVVYRQSAGKDGLVVEEEAGRAGPDNSHTVEGTVYGAECCEFKCGWSDPRPWFERAWDQSGLRLFRLIGLIWFLDKNDASDPFIYRRVVNEWESLVQWEANWALTKVKYLGYLAGFFLALAAGMMTMLWPAAGAGNGLFLGPILSLLIMALTHSLIRTHMKEARLGHLQYQGSQKFLRHANIGVIMIKPDHTIEYANPYILDVHGEVRGRKCHEALCWETEPCDPCPLSQAFENGRPTQADCSYLNRHGSSRWFHVTATPIIDPEGNVTSVINVATDITDRKSLEGELAAKRHELEASEYRYRSFMANAADAIVISSPEHEIIEANHRFVGMMDIEDMEAFVGKDLFASDLFHEEDTLLVRDKFDRMTRDRCPRAFETRLRRRDGAVIEVEARSIPILKDGEIAWVQSILRDITERKQDELAKSLMLSISNAIKDAPDLNAMIDHAIEGIRAVMGTPIAAIFMRDSDTQQLKLTAQVGMSAQAIRKLSIIAVDSGANNVASRCAILKKPIVIGDMEKIKANSETRHNIQVMGVASFASVPMLLDDELEGVIYLASRDRDYFTEKRMAAIKQVANELAVGIKKQRLSDVIREQNQELTRKNQELENATVQLLQSEKMASIGQLAAGVAHEINNPMGYINSNLNLLRVYREDLVKMIETYRDFQNFLDEKTLEPKARDALNRVAELEKKIDLDIMIEDINDMINESIEGAERVTHIVRNLKEFSHPEEGDPQVADIKDCIESTLKIVWNEIKYKAEVEKEYGDVPPIECFPQELKQVFMNLLVNAGQAIEERGKITIRTGADSGKAIIEISDTGAGIEPDKIRKIFDPFFTTKEVGKGTGLGLSITYGIIKKHRGTIDAKSEPGKGTTFTIALPLQLNMPKSNGEEEVILAGGDSASVTYH